MSVSNNFDPSHRPADDDSHATVNNFRWWHDPGHSSPDTLESFAEKSLGMPKTNGLQWVQLYDYILASNTAEGPTSYIMFEGEEAIDPEDYRSEGVEPEDDREPVNYVLSLTHVPREGSNEVGHFRAFTVYASFINWDREDQNDGRKIEFKWSDNCFNATFKAFTEKLIAETSDKLHPDLGVCVTTTVFWSALDQLKVDGAAGDSRATERLCEMLLSSHFAVGETGQLSMRELLGSIEEIANRAYQ